MTEPLSGFQKPAHHNQNHLLTLKKAVLVTAGEKGAAYSMLGQVGKVDGFNIK